jgi:hypothetical protein
MSAMDMDIANVNVCPYAHQSTLDSGFVHACSSGTALCDEVRAAVNQLRRQAEHANGSGSRAQRPVNGHAMAALDLAIGQLSGECSGPSGGVSST